MPYKSTEDLPENVQHVLPAHAHDRESRRFPPSSDRAYFERACFFAGTLKIGVLPKQPEDFIPERSAELRHCYLVRSAGALGWFLFPSAA